MTEWVGEERRGPTTLDCPGKYQVSLPLSTRMRQNLGTSGTHLSTPNRRIVPPQNLETCCSLSIQNIHAERHTHTPICVYVPFQNSLSWLVSGLRTIHSVGKDGAEGSETRTSCIRLSQAPRRQRADPAGHHLPGGYYTVAHPMWFWIWSSETIIPLQ